MDSYQKIYNLIILMLYLWTTCHSQGWSIYSWDYWVGWSTKLCGLDLVQSSIKSYERVEMDMRELVLHRLIQGNTHVAARVNGTCIGLFDMSVWIKEVLSTNKSYHLSIW